MYCWPLPLPLQWQCWLSPCSGTGPRYRQFACSWCCDAWRRGTPELPAEGSQKLLLRLKSSPASDCRYPRFSLSRHYHTVSSILAGFTGRYNVNDSWSLVRAHDTTAPYSSAVALQLNWRTGCRLPVVTSRTLDNGTGRGCGGGGVTMPTGESWSRCLGV